VRPFGAIIFGRIGDPVARKDTFLVTIVFMGISTVLVGFLPSYAPIGFAAPLILVLLRLVQGRALGGEYGGAATYVAEHAPDDKRGYATSCRPATSTTDSGTSVSSPEVRVKITRGPARSPMRSV
jgi:MFS family permease